MGSSLSDDLADLGIGITDLAASVHGDPGAGARFTPPERFDEYRVLRALGRGAMGQVYLGHDTLLDRAVAIKFIAAVEPDERARERFLIEARAIARLQHP